MTAELLVSSCCRESSYQWVEDVCLCVCVCCRTKALVLELLAAICLVSGGHGIIVQAFDSFKEVRKRFEWVKQLNSDRSEDITASIVISASVLCIVICCAHYSIRNNSAAACVTVRTSFDDEMTSYNWCCDWGALCVGFGQVGEVNSMCCPHLISDNIVKETY